MPRQPEPQKEEKKPAPPATTTGKGKEIGTQPTTTEQEESPNMVDEILGRTTGQKQAKRETAETHTSEENRDIKYAQSGNTKQKHTQETARKEEKRRVPPPASARVDESKIDEVAVARLEKARLERLSETGKDIKERQGTKEFKEEPNNPKENQERLDTAGSTEEKDQPRMQQSQPLTPLLPRDESPIGDGSTTEEMEEEKQEQAAGAEPRQQPAQPSEAWRKITRPAEPQMPNKWKVIGSKTQLDGKQAQLKLDQLAYLTMWMKEDEETRQFWEGRQPDQEADTAQLAREMQKMDLHIGQGATAQCIASQLTEWGFQEVLKESLQETTPETTYGGVNHYR